MKTIEELQRALTTAGLDRIAPQIVKLARQCYRIDRSLTHEDQIPIGSSKFGGSPDVPAGFVWPQTSHPQNPAHMEFVGQIQLSDLPQPLPEPVGREGLLSFFTRWSEGNIFFYPEGTALQRTLGPELSASATPSRLWQRVKA